MTLPVGTLLLPRKPTLPGRAAITRLDPRAAAVASLAAYLRCAKFQKWGAEAADTEFQLKHVMEEWADPAQLLEYPTAAIVDSTPGVMQAHNLVPTPQEDTLDVYGAGTVLWKIAEYSELLQVDFYCQSAPEREAIYGALPGLFAPGEDSARVVLSGHPAYFCAPVRCSFEGAQRMDAPDVVYEGERRLLARIWADVDVLELRCATVLAITTKVKAEPGLDVSTPAPESGKLAPGCAEDC